MADPDTSSFVVVYQFGKVASTAVVAALNGQSGIEAVQSHFLGEPALRATLEACLNPALNEYFAFHKLGQLQRNIEITRRVNRLVAGHEPSTRLVVLLTVREPLDWFRSAVTQDAEGYADLFHFAKARYGLPGETLEELALPAFSAVLGEIAEVLESFGSVDACLQNRQASLAQMRKLLPNSILQELFYTAVRPFDWHHLLLEPAFGCTLNEFVPNGDLQSLHRPRLDAHLFRYEDLSTALPQIAREIGLGADFAVPEQNVSKGKTLDAQIRAAFRSDAARKLANLFAATDYARRFGYASSEAPCASPDRVAIGPSVVAPVSGFPQGVEVTATLHKESPLLCPACTAGAMEYVASLLRCTACGFVTQTRDGILDLRESPDDDTLLDIDTYEDRHSVSRETSERLFRFYADVLTEVGSEAEGRLLEIGAGTGNLTLPLASLGNFSEIHCSDLSPRFLARLIKKISTPPKKPELFSYLLDANRLPFRSGYFDVVLGHSVLHHLIDFEHTIADAYRILRPGGVAMFGEPIMEGHALLHLAAGQIAAAEAAGLGPPLQPRSRGAMAVIAGRGAIKMRNLKLRDSALRQVEDKFIFPTDVLRRTALRVGFSRIEIRKHEPGPDLAGLLWSQLSKMLNDAGGDADNLAPYRCLLSPFSTAYGASMGDDLLPLFAYAVLVK